MNRISGSYFFLLLGFILFMDACKQHPAQQETPAAGQTGDPAVLRKPPFAALTDSLANASGADLAPLHFRRAELLSHNNFHELAVADYSAAWALQPDANTGLRYAATLSIVGEADSAIRLLQECRRRFPTQPEFPDMLGDLYTQEGKYKEALDLYSSLLQSDSLNFEAWYEKGLLLEKAGDTTAAIDALHKAYGLQPMATYALELAHLYAETGNSTALALCDQVLRKDSSHSLLDPFFIKGIYYSNTNQYGKALIQFDSCIGRDWKFTDAYLEKGIVLFHKKNYDLALTTFQMCIKVSNTYPDGYFWTGRCYEAKGNKEDAVLYYQRALGLDKDFTEAAEGIRRLK